MGCIKMTEKLSSYNNIVILTGAGVSVASGLKTYRGKEGVWEEYEVKKYGYIGSLLENPDKVWQLFGGQRAEVQRAKPNKVHYYFSELESKLFDEQSITLITQNVDGLHRIAGSNNVVELHGNINKTRCTNEDCSTISFIDKECHLNTTPKCHSCGELLRPDIVLFGEQISVHNEWMVKQALRKCDLFLSIGTSGVVAPASNYVRSAKYSEAKTISINIEKQSPKNSYFDIELIGDCSTILHDNFS
jgi:NAD-dependent deacetylase